MRKHTILIIIGLIAFALLATTFIPVFAQETSRDQDIPTVYFNKVVEINQGQSFTIWLLGLSVLNPQQPNYGWQIAGYKTRIIKLTGTSISMPSCLPDTDCGFVEQTFTFKGKNAGKTDLIFVLKNKDNLNMLRYEIYHIIVKRGF